MGKSKKAPEDILRIVQETIEAALREISNERLKLDLERDELAELLTRAQPRKLAKKEREELERFRRDSEEFQQEREQFEEERRRFTQGRANAGVPPNKDRSYHAKMLGISGRVTRSDVRAAYLAAVRQWHPDKVAQMHPELIAFATQKMSEVNEAMDYFRKHHGV